MGDLFMRSGAVFSPCCGYRYRLWRRWGDGPTLLFVMLNPSTADEDANDPTVERCERRACSMKFGALEVVNIFSLRSTDPGALYDHPDPVGPENDRAIIAAATEAGMIVCAWGTHGHHLDRGAAVRQALKELARPVHVLGVNGDGSPKHPLYVGYRATPVPWV